ncbi:MAG TPA: LCP family protein [Streptosporangiaceae bacterium]|nr:LCP family protein [Streptosporangiaceae bacterium]
MGLGKGFRASLRLPFHRPPATPRAPRYSTRQKILGGMAIFSAGLLVSLSLVAYLNFRADWNGITRINVGKDLKDLRAAGVKLPPPDPDAMNILLIGSDSRAGVNRQFGATVAGQRSDTIMVVHIAPDAHEVVVLSLPRDTVVPILTCAPEDGSPGQTAQPGQVEQINATFAYGGPGCLWATIEATTGIHLNDFIELTFTGFEHVIDDLGGVNVCLPVAINNSDSKLHLSAGKHHIWGPEALAFWRVRYIGDGSDLQRIERDQYLMAAVLQGIERSGMLGSPTELYRIITDITRNHLVATDTGLTPGQLLAIGEDLRGTPSSAVHFIEAPVVPYPGDPTAWVQWEEPQATKLFSAIAHDTRLPAAKTPPRLKTGSPPVLASVSPSDVRVSVLNGTTTAGLATSTYNTLARLGYTVVGQPGDASDPDYIKSVILYPSAAGLPAARTLARLIGDSRLVADPAVAHGTVQLILGSTFPGLNARADPPAASPSLSATPSPSPTASSGLQNLQQQYGGISGNVGLCSDSSDFTGPDGA